MAGLAIVKFGGSGIRLTTNGGNIIAADQIGTDPSGASGLGNMGDAVTIVGAPGNTIGGTISQLSNQLSNSGGSGISISGAGATGNVVEGNFIGTNAAFASLGNSGDGVDIVGGVSGNTIGGTVAGAGNTIGDNHRFGVEMIDGATSIAVQGNLTEVNALGGIGLNNAPGNTIGGTTSQARNVIIGNISSGLEILGAGSTGNLVQGNYIGVDASGTHPEGNPGPGMIIEAPGNTIGGTEVGAGNVISGNGGFSLNPTDIGLWILGPVATGNVVQGNFIGTDYTGTQSLGNNGDGLVIQNAPGNTIGGTVSGAGNVISGNARDGLELVDAGATDNLVEGNFIGTTYFIGTTKDVNPLGNDRYGVLITSSELTSSSASGNTIGGTAQGAGNLISGNLQGGISIAGFNGGGMNNLVQGNKIGTDFTGTLKLPNLVDGVAIINAADNTIGGPAQDAANVIAGNHLNGIEITGTGATGNLVQGNYIGTNSDGTSTINNVGDGVLIEQAAQNTILGCTISGNSANGIEIFGSGTNGTVIQGNRIGTLPGGESGLGNFQNGILINGSPGNRIGGMDPGEGNLISGNLNNGILIENQTATGNLVEGNLIGTDATGEQAS